MEVHYCFSKVYLRFPLKTLKSHFKICACVCVYMLSFIS